MAGTGTKLINKLARRTKSVREDARGVSAGQFDKTYLDPKTTQKSPRAYQLLRKAARRMARAMGNFTLARNPVLHAEYVATSLGRHDYGSGDYGTQLTIAANEAGYIGAGAQVGDYVEVAQQNAGAAAGQYLKVVALTDSTHLRLTDVPGLAYAGVKQVTDVTTVADSAGSLNSTYWTLSTPTTHYYVWYSDGTGVDPAPGGTGIPVTYADNDSAIIIATLTKAALDGIVGAWTTTRSNNMLTITDQAAGPATDAANGTASPGFTISTPTAGLAANPTPAAQSNVAVRFEINDKKSYS